MVKKAVAYTLVGMLTLLFLVGCIDYKAYDLDQQQTSEEDLLDEIAMLEQDVMENQQSNQPEEVVEDVVLPELKETSEEAMDSMEQMENLDNSEGTSEMKVLTVKENDKVTLNAVIQDPDEDPVTFSFSAPLNEQGEWQTNYGDAGEYVVTLTATDGILTSSQKIKLVVERVNVPPVIDPLQDITVNEGDVVELEPVVRDPNGDAVSVDITAPLSEGIFATDHTSAGEYQITVKADDGELQAERRFVLTINDINELPVLSNLQDITIMEGETVLIKPVVEDLDGDEVVVTISDPVGDDGEWQTLYTDHGEYQITVRANDGKDVVTETILLTVEDVNKAPQIVDISLRVN